MSSPEDAPTLSPDEPTAAEVIDYLHRHPDVLIRHSDLFARNHEPSGKVIDFRQVMIERLKSELDTLRAATDELIQTARQNLSLQTRTHQAVVALVAADSFEGLCHAIADDLPPLLDVDVAVLCIEPGIIPPAAPMTPLAAGDVVRLLGTRDTALRNHIQGDPRLYGEMASLVCSEALAHLDLGPYRPPALLALGARGGDTFQPGQGTELLTFLAVTLGHCVRRWATPAP